MTLSTHDKNLVHLNAPAAAGRLAERSIVILFTLAVFALSLTGCASYSTQVDLNNDGSPDSVVGNYSETHFYYADFVLKNTLSSDRAGQARVIARFNGRPEEIRFVDFDNDGDVDLQCIQISKTRWDRIIDGEYVALNDGKGNFGDLKRISEPVAAATSP